MIISQDRQIQFILVPVLVWWQFCGVNLIIIGRSPHTCSRSGNVIIIIIDRFCMPLFSALEQTHCAHIVCDCQWATVSFYSAFFLFFFSSQISTEVVYWQHSLVVVWLVPRETAAVSAQVLRTTFNPAPLYSVTSPKATQICSLQVCLTVSCHLHIWQNDRELFRVAAVTRGWNGYRNKSQHRKLTLEKKSLPPKRWDWLEPGTFLVTSPAL